MNQIRAIQALNKREIENGVPPEASWHVDYRDTAFVYFGGLPYELSEGDIITIFSQYGEPVFLKLARDKETGKSKGFGWLKYEDQRSTDLAVDNLGGAEIAGRLVRVDHARYKLRDDEDPDECRVGWEDMLRRERAEKGLRSDDEEEGSGTDEDDKAKERKRPMLEEERELQLLIQNHDDDDPMKQFLIDEKKKEIAEALLKETKRSERHRSHSHRHRDKDRHHHHRSYHRSPRRDDRDSGDDEPCNRDRHRNRDIHDSDRKRRSRRDDPSPDSGRRRDDKEVDDRRKSRRRDSRDRELESRHRDSRDPQPESRRDRHDRDRDPVPPRRIKGRAENDDGWRLERDRDPEHLRRTGSRVDEELRKERDRHRKRAREDDSPDYADDRRHGDLGDRTRRDRKKTRSRSPPPRP
ncbi:RNA-binding domain-containing protein [Podospora didyma]|uniref:RNA-binding domain-containing protein n=1 Tax=Podospora didyma TaxID=330526 RepID=A0AAE0N6K8_9PEZI|nr:RNA-binding domain-containing protein [Podospora didyma]